MKIRPVEAEFRSMWREKR